MLMWPFKKKKTESAEVKAEVESTSVIEDKNKTIKVEQITDGDKLLYAGCAQMNVEIDDPESLFNAKWVCVDDEMPTEEGLYHILTDEGWSSGIATYFKNEETGKLEFDVWWATSGKEPKVLYWLKYQHWPLIYLLKKRKGDFGKKIQKKKEGSTTNEEKS